MNKNNSSKPLVVIQCYEDRQQTLPLRSYEQSDVTTNNQAPPKREATDHPPPPPPMPATNGHQNGHAKVVANNTQNMKPVLQEIIKTQTLRKGTLTRTPTPDYNNKSESFAQLKLKSKDEKAELESLESYKLKNPVNVPPKPPSNYFMRAPNGTATMKKLARPVSVTIGEYAGGGGRREPTKLDFLNGDKIDGAGAPEDVPITNRLQSELAMTLSRSNLRKKTEALDLALAKYNYARGLLHNEDSDTSIDKNFHARYGNYLHPLPPSINIPKVAKPRYHADAGR